MVKDNFGKRAVFFSTDALIALIIIFLSILVIFPIMEYSQMENLIQADILEVLSSLKIGEIDNAYVHGLISGGQITDLNKSVLEQIGEFYITDETVARNLAGAVISTIDANENVGIWYGNDLLASKNSSSFESATEIDVKKQLVSGIRDPLEEGGVTAFSARAFLTNKIHTRYFYFGGYVGDGNISVLVDYEGNLTDMNFEIAINNEFDVYINGQHSGHYDSSPSDETPSAYDPSYESYFSNGENIIEFVGDNLHITGGYVKITYENSVQYEQPFKYYFPGIQGVVNLYDSFYIPGGLNEISIFLHYKSPYSMFLNVGNTTVFNDHSSTETSQTISNSELSSLLNYNLLSEKTIPLRLGLADVSYYSNLSVDIFSIVELSGSMNQQVPSVGEKVLDLVKEGNQEFIATILGENNFRAGLIGYDGDAEDLTQQHELSTNIGSLSNTITSWAGGSGSCTCCGIYKAIERFEAESDDSKQKSMVLMSDGKANVACLTGNAKQDAIDSACDAYNNHDIEVHVIGFGPTTTIDGTTLQAIADCGGGNYYYSNASELADIYRQVANQMINLSYVEQITYITGDFENTILYPDSYIAFDYSSDEVPYGLITTIQTEDFGNTLTEGSFFVPDDAEIIEAKVISYSSSKWTDNVYVYNESVGWENIFSLFDYGSDYVELGDPYVINLPLDYLKTGNNRVKITSGVSPDNSTGSSASDKAIYTIMRSASTYSDISFFAEGCIWELQFEDDSNLTMNIPASYDGTDVCYYTKDNHAPPAIGKDAIQSAVYNLLKLLDLDENGKLNIKFTEQDLQITSSEVSGIPYDYSMEVQVRKWH